MIFINPSEILSRFKDVKKRRENEWAALCPCHDDKRQSLSISVGKDGKILMHCFAGCKNEDILNCVGLTMKDLIGDNREDGNSISAIYYYPNGTRKIRYKNKQFIWQHLVENKWILGRGNAKNVLYIQGKNDDRIYFCEGEKDADNLAKIGFYSASMENGANSNWQESYNDQVKDKIIYIIMDNDEAGHMYAETVAKNAINQAKEIKLIDLSKVWTDMPPKADISDMLVKFGIETTKELLEKLIENTEPYKTDENTSLLEKLACDERGNIKKTARNFLTIMENDPFYKDIKYNTLKDYPEIVIDGKRTLWKDENDSISRNYIEEKYGLSSPSKHDDAFKEFLTKRKYDPMQELIKSFKWDGVERCQYFCQRILGTEDNEYYREISRLIFAGGINRFFNPGCKFDNVFVLKGNQGAGKSTICQWLALHPDFYSSTKTIQGQKGYEAIDGKCIVEIEELLATLTTRQGTKMEEATKAFLSTSSDTYRRPYCHRPSDVQRHCIFFGTTNRDSFLTDKTGNRRWFPIACNMNASDLYKNEEAIKYYIQQCWAEMYYYFINHLDTAKPIGKPGFADILKETQVNYEEDDPRIGIIEKYLTDKNETCCAEIWSLALHPSYNVAPDISPQISREIGEILNKLGFISVGPRNTLSYGKQRVFVRKST